MEWIIFCVSFVEDMSFQSSSEQGRSQRTSNNSTKFRFWLTEVLLYLHKREAEFTRQLFVQ